MPRTLADMRTAITIAMGEPLSTTEIDAAVNEAIASIQDSLFIQLAPVSANTVDGTYEYAIGTALVVVTGVDLAGEALPPFSWDIVEGTAPLLRFNQAYFPNFTTTPVYRIHGFTFQAFVTTAANPIYVDQDYILAQAASILHASRLNIIRESPESERMRAIHEQEQSKYSTLAQGALQRAVAAQGIPPTARRVRSNMMA